MNPAQPENFQSHNPATGEVLWEGPAASAADVDAAFRAAAAAFPAWSRLSLAERSTVAERFKSLLERDKTRLARLISDETGKPNWECLTEVAAMIGKLAVSLSAYAQRCSENSQPMPGGLAHSITRWRPIGPMAVFGPFNLPMHLPNGHIIPALLAGNTLVFKPSEQTPACGEAMVKLWTEAGLPDGVLNLVQGARDTGVALTAHPSSHGVLFTGSYPTGAAIHKALAGQPEKMLALEMGGNNPLVVWQVADFKAAAHLIIQSAFISSGQRCVCARRLILPSGPEGDQVLVELLHQCSGIRVGLPRDEAEPFMGPLISAASAQHLLKAQSLLLTQGARSLLTMAPQPRCPALLSPGIIDVTAVPERLDHEFFGPLLQVIRVPDFAAALEEANDTAFGLAAGLISDSAELYAEFRASSNAGIVNWNRQITGASSSAPFGGTGKSGNFRPGAFLAADYCATPVASIEAPKVEVPSLCPGLELK